MSKRVDPTVDIDHVMIILKVPPNELGFDLIGPMPKSEIESAKLYCVNLLDEIAPDARYGCFSLHGKPLADVVISPNLETWTKSAKSRTYKWQHGTL